MRRYLLATLLLISCGDDPQTTADAEVTGGGDDSGGDVTGGVDAGSDVLVTGDANVDQPIIPPPCEGPVCFEALATSDYPEAQEPPVHALHCNEWGLGSGCPLGTRCGEVVLQADGRRIPVCEPLTDRLDLLDVDLITSSAASADDGEAVAVDVLVALSGELLPERNEGAAAAGSRIVFTHVDSETQWWHPLDDGSSEGFRIHLRPGLHDVLVILRRADFVGGNVPDMTIRGVLEVEAAGEAAIDLPVFSVDVALRLRGQILTSAESGLMRLTMSGSDGRAVNYSFTPNDRGQTTLQLLEGRYALRLDVAPGLEGLFPTLPLRIDVPINVPEANSVRLDLDPVTVAGTLSRNGDPAGPTSQGTGGLAFVDDGRVQRVSIVNDGEGTFRGLAWEHQPFDVFHTDSSGTATLIATGVTHADAPFEFDVETEDVTIRLDISQTTLPLGNEQWVRLWLRHPDWPEATTGMLTAPERAGDTLFFEGRMVTGQPVDVLLSGEQMGLPSGLYPLALGHELAALNDFEVEVGSLYLEARVRLPNGTDAELNSASINLRPVGGRPNETLWLGLGNVGGQEYTVYQGSYDIFFQPGWLPNREVPGGTYPFGEIEVDESAVATLVLPAYPLEGTARVDGALLPTTEMPGQYRGGLQFLDPGVIYHGVEIARTGVASYQTSLGPGTYQVMLYCLAPACAEVGADLAYQLVYDGLSFGVAP